MLKGVKPNIAIMCFSSGRGGMESDALKLARLLAPIGRVFLVFKEGSYIHDMTRSEAGDYDCVPVSFYSRSFSPSMLIAVRRLIAEHAIDNVIFFGASELKTLYFSFLGYDLNVIVRHGTTKKTPKRDWLHRLIYSCVNTHVALSNHLMNNVKSIVPDSPDVKYKCISQSYICDCEALPCNEEEGLLKIIHVGRLVGGKGQLDAIKACAVLYENNIKFSLTLVGSCDNEKYMDEVHDLLSTTPYSDSVIFTGHVSEVADYLAVSNVLLFPSKGEGMPNALIESLHYGLVCITYDNTVFPEFIEMGFNMHVVESGNVCLLADMLLKAAKDISNEKMLASSNVDLAMKLFSPERELEKWKSELV